ncbi:MAG TPA: type 1 glutamine amidotransferase domain-containing protein [Candidatus Kapabacteria bacterium]|jgi:protease I|nr:type 1 glutamine amidotransferase domain-containing protein [Candidatus Kapabacteria bacterium]HOM04112.1 type 1 glutamine amidotransferase domain-containing protein [Candidatus Kapabacteria bacterium]HOQ49004.1 type 1 glutamine amidotransferase domain-containing protein [Candidatus Kapabacteria bacterium]HPP38749.1 type 1 glutamine amidotransferase domain-containing protein [Candidatus Kapabacteria bacterium]
MCLEGKNIAILLAEFYEEIEFWYPYYRMKEAGAKVLSIASTNNVFAGKNGLKAKPDEIISNIGPENFDAVIVPGGFAPDYMRRDPQIIDFVRRMNEQNKLTAAICHGPWLFASAKIIVNKTVTSFYSIKDDLVNAGAYWIDQEVVVDGKIITSRNPNDLPIFCKTIIELLSKD